MANASLRRRYSSTGQELQPEQRGGGERGSLLTSRSRAVGRHHDCWLPDHVGKPARRRRTEPSAGTSSSAKGATWGGRSPRGWRRRPTRSSESIYFEFVPRTTDRSPSWPMPPRHPWGGAAGCVARDNKVTAIGPPNKLKALLSTQTLTPRCEHEVVASSMKKLAALMLKRRSSNRSLAW